MRFLTRSEMQEAHGVSWRTDIGFPKRFDTLLGVMLCPELADWLSHNIAGVTWEFSQGTLEVTNHMVTAGAYEHGQRNDGRYHSVPLTELTARLLRDLGIKT